jgi:hypothetical protein
MKIKPRFQRDKYGLIHLRIRPINALTSTWTECEVHLPYSIQQYDYYLPFDDSLTVKDVNCVECLARYIRDV